MIFNIQNIILNRHPKFQVTEKPELLYGINEITTEVQALGFDACRKVGNQRCDADPDTLLCMGTTGVRARWMYGCR